MPVTFPVLVLAEYFPCIISVLSISSKVDTIIIIPFYIWGNWGLEMLSSLTKLFPFFLIQIVS